MQNFRAFVPYTAMAFMSATALAAPSCAEIVGIEPWDVTGGAGGSGVSVTGTGGTGGGGTLPAGPSILRPSAQQVLPPRLAYLLWLNGEIPSGRTVTGYEICSTSGDASTIEGEMQCPDSAVVSNFYSSLGPLSRNATFHWKVRARFDDGSNSLYSALRTFTTDDSLIAWWRMDEGMGSLVADSGANINDGTLAGSPAWVAGRDGQALQFNGSNYVLVGDRPSLEGMERLSVETWLKTTAAGTTRHIVSKWSAVDRSFALRTSSAGDGRLSFQTFTSGAAVLTSADPFNDGNWHHVIGTYDGAAQQLYIDLAMQASGVQNGSIADTTSEMCLAESCNGGVGTGFGFDGMVDETAVYNRELTAEERSNSFCATQAQGGVEPMSPACLP